MDNQTIGFQEAVQRAIKAIHELAKALVAIFSKIWKIIKNVAIGLSIGYTRYFKRHQLAYYKSISYGKTNNWRKIHGLPLIRRNC